MRREYIFCICTLAGDDAWKHVCMCEQRCRRPRCCVLQWDLLTSVSAVTVAALLVSVPPCLSPVSPLKLPFHVPTVASQPPCSSELALFVCLLVTAGSSVSMKQSHHSDNSVSGSLWSAGCSDIEQLCSLIIIVVCAFVLHRYQHSETWIHSFPVARKQYCMFRFHVEGMRCHSVRWLLFSEDISLM